MYQPHFIDGSVYSQVQYLLKRHTFHWYSTVPLYQFYTEIFNKPYQQAGAELG